MSKETHRRPATGVGRLFVEALRSIFEKEGPTTAGAIAYFSLFSILPAMILIITVCEHVLGVFDLRNTVIHKVLEVFPGARPVILENLSDLATPSWTVLFISLLTFLWSSSWVFMFVESALNKAWRVTQSRTFWRSRMMALGMIILCFIMLAGSILLTGTIASVRAMTYRLNTGIMPESVLSLFWQLVLAITGFFLNLVVFTLVYKIVPNTRVRFLEALTGALVASAFWQLSNYIFAWYTPYFLQHQKLYGSLGAVIGLLTWVYISTLILLYGAHFSVNMHRLKAIEKRKLAIKLRSTHLRSALQNVKD
ncbi:MAG: YihY/virulence factor BrkB family protein [Acidobacteria bacterium]|nr:YihY/virulence factor BrkB family protein [Acidobacteriota bacterium]MBI3657521.1 YihY/virulence factor BrkB family protein [Acidobacteriota bacterium]